MNLDVDRLRPNEPDIASKIMGGEAILINLRTGAYYSLRDAGAVVWQAILDHRTQSEIVEAVAAAWDLTPRDVRADVATLLGELAREDLVRASEAARAIVRANGPRPDAVYGRPVLEKFTDMEELLALDPPTPGALDNLMRQPLKGRDA